MIKRVYCFLIIIFIVQFLFSQSEQNDSYYISDMGFDYEISNNLNWGYGEPVITIVIPDSPAEKAGLKPNDIIMEINGVATFLRQEELLEDLLFNRSTKNNIDLTIRNFGNSFVSKSITNKVIPDTQLSERDLAIICAPYDFENSRAEKFTVPIKIKSLNNDDVDYSDFYSFDFENKTIKSEAKQIIIDIMTEKGLKYDSTNPDFHIDLSYSYKKQEESKNNKLQTTNIKSNNEENVKRFLFKENETVVFPVTYSELNEEYLGQISLIFYEKNIIKNGEKTKIWEANISEFFAEDIKLNLFFDTYIPLMLMAYPYVSDCNSITYEFEKRNFLYTGIQYHSMNFPLISNVDINSPAYKSGIRRNQTITKVQKRKICQNLDELLFDINLFQDNTKELRYEEGFNNDNLNSSTNRFCKQDEEKELTKIFKNRNYNTVFSYIYDYNKFINPKYDGIIEFEMEDKNRKYKRLVKAENKQENIIRILNYDRQQ